MSHGEVEILINNFLKQLIGIEVIRELRPIRVYLIKMESIWEK